MLKAPDVVVIGSGCAGQAAARTLTRLGARVAVVDWNEAALSRLRADGDCDDGDGISLFVGWARVTGPCRIKVRGPSGTVALRARAIILATGRDTTDIGLQGLGVERDPDGFLRVDDRCRTRVPGLFAVGDVTGPPFSVEKAKEEGRVAALAAMGKPARVAF